MTSQQGRHQHSVATRVLAYPRSLLWAIGALVSTIFFGSAGLVVAAFMPYRARYRWFSIWSLSMVWLAKVCCGVQWRVEGLENIPEQPGIVMSKHQSAWETLALQAWFRPQTWVLKRELMWIPFLGWALHMLEPIAINRASVRESMREIIRQGSLKVADGRWVIVFPEGTRVAPGKSVRFRRGGAVLATETGASITPVAHNAGEFWPRNSFIKYPGTITVRIGKPITSTGKNPEELLDFVQEWIETNSMDVSTLKQPIA
jgi:1-acyl-sn-glycerol-3-phosphate acyltransferase